MYTHHRSRLIPPSINMRKYSNTYKKLKRLYAFEGFPATPTNWKRILYFVRHHTLIDQDELEEYFSNSIMTYDAKVFDKEILNRIIYTLANMSGGLNIRKLKLPCWYSLVLLGIHDKTPTAVTYKVKVLSGSHFVGNTCKLKLYNKQLVKLYAQIKYRFKNYTKKQIPDKNLYVHAYIVRRNMDVLYPTLLVFTPYDVRKNKKLFREVKP